MAILTDGKTGLETLQRELLKILHTNLNTELVATAAYWAPLDITFATSMGQAPLVIDLEVIPDSNFISGHKPSLIERGPDAFPTVTVMAYQVQAGGDTRIDTAWGLQDRIAVESLVKAGTYSENDVTGIGEQIVNSRIQRQTDAIISVIGKNRTLNGLVSEIVDTPGVSISEVFAVTERDGKWFWQGSRIDLTIYRHSQLQYG